MHQGGRACRDGIGRLRSGAAEKSFAGAQPLGERTDKHVKRG